jgi:hypothetical protein
MCPFLRSRTASLLLFASLIALLTVLRRSSPLEEPTMSAATLLKAVTIAPAAKHTATVIFVHGLGDSGHGWKPVGDVRALAQYLTCPRLSVRTQMLRRDPALAHVKWVFPHAPTIPITVNFGQSMPGWYVVCCTALSYKFKLEGLRFDIFKLGFDRNEMDQVCTCPAHV